MTIRATQAIASRFGTYLPGDAIDAAAAATVLDAWLAAGIVVDEPEDEAVAEEPVRAPKKKESGAPVEAATRRARETTVSRRMQTGPPPHRRFQTGELS